MTTVEIKSIIEEFLVDEFEVESEVIEDDADMQKSLGLDSLDYVDLFATIEQHFGIKLMVEDFEKIITFKDLYNYIEAKLVTV
ncbi:MAG: acyl carrier protein [Bacteroidetes bacterium]|nr:acyl carrier protein [Bacteroidota bacterium]